MKCIVCGEELEELGGDVVCQNECPENPSFGVVGGAEGVRITNTPLELERK